MKEYLLAKMILLYSAFVRIFAKARIFDDSLYRNWIYYALFWTEIFVFAIIILRGIIRLHGHVKYLT
jgi:hypothetical protein